MQISIYNKTLIVLGVFLIAFGAAFTTYAANDNKNQELFVVLCDIIEGTEPGPECTPDNPPELEDRDRGHGNNDDGCDEDNPGKSKRCSGDVDGGVIHEVGCVFQVMFDLETGLIYEVLVCDDPV